MKVYISVDMEGISGIVRPEQVTAGKADYEKGRLLMTADTNAAIEAAFAAGATEVVVNDSHGSMCNILIDKLDPRAELISGSIKPESMVQGLDETYDACMFVGYHSMIGTQTSVMEHTYYAAEVFSIKINGQPVGEIALNAYWAGCVCNVPLVFVSGDKTTTREVARLNPAVTAVSVKEACSRFSAKCLAPSVAHERMKDGIKEALAKADRIQPMTLEGEITLEVELTKTNFADVVELIYGLERTGSRTFRFQSEDYREILRMCRLILLVANTQRNAGY